MKLVNATRTTKSIPRKLLTTGQLHLLPVYYLMQLSDLAREGILNSGSHEFADHIYRSEASGQFMVGILIDKILLSLPSSRSFRNRYYHARDEIIRHALANNKSQINILSIPSGIPREIIEAASKLRRDFPVVFQRSKFYCVDKDPVALKKGMALIKEHQFTNFEVIRGDAFDVGAYPGEMDIITSTGFGEFLGDSDLRTFYNMCFEKLSDTGTFITSATVRHRFSDYLMKNIAELITQYREEPVVTDIFSRTKFKLSKLQRDTHGYQIFITANKRTTNV